MTISIIIPYYNGENFIDKLLQSIKESICGVPDSYYFEIIIVIDSIATDFNTLHVLANSYFFDLINVTTNVIKNEANIGVAASRNAAIKIAKGDFLHIIDQDDEIDFNFYDTAISFSKAFNFILFNGIVNYNNTYNSHLWFYIPPSLSLKALLTNDYIRSPGQVFFEKKLIENIHFPEKTLNKGTDDRFFWLNIFLKKANILRPYYCKKPYYIANIHNLNFSSNKTEMLKSSVENCELICKQNPSLTKNFRFYCHIQSQKFVASMPLSLLNTILAIFTRVVYFLEPNKIVRYVYKRI